MTSGHSCMAYLYPLRLPLAHCSHDEVPDHEHHLPQQCVLKQYVDLDQKSSSSWFSPKWRSQASSLWDTHFEYGWFHPEAAYHAGGSWKNNNWGYNPCRCSTKSTYCTIMHLLLYCRVKVNAPTHKIHQSTRFFDMTFKTSHQQCQWQDNDDNNDGDETIRWWEWDINELKMMRQ